MSKSSDNTVTLGGVKGAASACAHRFVQFHGKGAFFSICRLTHTFLEGTDNPFNEDEFKACRIDIEGITNLGQTFDMFVVIEIKNAHKPDESGVNRAFGCTNCAGLDHYGPGTEWSFCEFSNRKD